MQVNQKYMRKKIVAGNWKMNNTLDEGVFLVEKILNLQESTATDDVLKILGVPSTHLSVIGSLLKGKADFSVAAQNSHHEEKGAYTGEISARMIASTNVHFVIVGHSERRQYFNETNELLAKKVNQVLENGMTPIYCVGESLEQRKKNEHFDVVKSQLQETLFHLPEEDIKNLVIAYEPVWAIGTGETATSEQAQEIHAFIRGILSDKYGNVIADSISILYGGSCNVTNAKELFACPDIDGGLIGGASLKATDFVAITSSF